MKRPISHILHNMVPLWISMLKLLKQAPKSLPSMKKISRNDGKGPGFLRRATRCGGSLETHSFRWAPKTSCKKRMRLNLLVSGCGGRSYMAESFRVYQYHHVLNVLSAADQAEAFNTVPCSADGACTASSTIITEDTTSPAASEFWDLLALHPDTLGGGGFDAMAKYSRDPCSDFARSMTEMIVAYSLTESHDLEALFHCYLRLNASIHHPTITLAFLTALAALDKLGYPHARREFAITTAFNSAVFLS